MSPLLLTVVLAAWPELPLPPGQTLHTESGTEVNYAELTVEENGKPVKVRGHRWRGYGESVNSADELWAAWKPLLLKQGWVSTGEHDGHCLKRVDGKTEWRLRISAPNYDAPLVVLVQVGGTPMTLEVKPLPAVSKQVKDDEDFPFAPMFPGTGERSGSGRAEVPFTVTRGTRDPLFIADAMYLKSYPAPSTLSRLEAVLAASEALKRAGWNIAVSDEEAGIVQAHYVKNGRDVWLQVGHAEDGTSQALSYAVVDLGEEDLGKALDTDCKVTLRGVTFEYNKATLKPESEVTLARVGKALSSRAAMKLEVGGHTDAQGSDAYNQKLSEQRAASVVTWLTSHGVAAGRLSSKGYGETVPVGDNGTDEGRAKNRRVELNCQK